jgi:PST family polysaccharide transporter
MSEAIPDCAPRDAEPQPLLKPSAVHGAAILGITQAVKLGLSILTTIIVARVLTPNEYGVSAMVAPILAFIYMAQDFGFGVTTIQRPSLSAAESSAMFWLNVIASLILAALLLASAPFFSWFYKDVRAGYATAAAAPSILITSFALQHTALLTREMRFSALCACELVHAAVLFVTTTALAFWLENYWALLLGAITAVTFHSVAMWRACAFRPAWPPSTRAARGLLRSGSHLTGSAFLNFLVRNADTVLVAKFSGPASAGLYDRCYRLMMLPLQNINGPLSRVLLPLLSRNQNEPAKYRRQFLLAARGMMLASTPGIAIATATSSELMPFLLGPNWADAGPIFFWLGLTGLLQAVGTLAALLLISRGLTGRIMRVSFATAVFTLVAFLIGLRWGPQGVAAGFFFSTLLRLPAVFYICAKDSPVTTLDLWRVQLEPLLGAALAALLAHRLLSVMPLLTTLAVSLPTAYLLSVGTSLCLSRDGRTQSLELAGIAKRFLLRSPLAQLLPRRTFRI